MDGFVVHRLSRLLKNSAEPPLRLERAARKAARKGGILGEAIPFRANAAGALSGATRRATRIWAGNRVRAAGQGSPSIAPAALPRSRPKSCVASASIVFQQLAKAARMSATSFSGGRAASSVSASRGGSSASNCDRSMLSFMKWPWRRLRRWRRRAKSPCR